MTIHPNTLDAYKLLHDAALAFARAEKQGIRVDIDYVNAEIEKLTERISELESNFKRTKFYKHWQHAMGKVNINSNPQLSVFLYKIKKIKPVKTTITGQGSTDEEALLQLNIPELNELLEIRKFKKIRDTYLDAFARECVRDYMHPNFNLHLVKTYRSSSSSPNFQNIPIRDEESMLITRKALYARPDHQLLEIDYSQLEVKIAACYNKDPMLLRYINDPKSDMHADMAKQIFLLDKYDKNYYMLRQAAKNGFVFPQFYGDYYGNCAYNMACNWGKLSQSRWKSGEGIILNSTTLSDHLISKGIKSFDAFTEHVKQVEKDFWGNRFRVYEKWKDTWWTAYQRTGYIDMLTGFRCSGVLNKKDATNYPVQGSAFHCLLWSFIELDKLIQTESLCTKLIGQIHDSILLDVHPDELEYVSKIVQRVTCEDLPKAWGWIITPMEIEMNLCAVNQSWAEKQEYKPD